MPVELYNLKGYPTFRATGQPELLKSLENLLNCEVKLIGRPVTFAKSRGYDIETTPKRGCYIFDDKQVMLVSRVAEKDEDISFVGFLLKGNCVSKIPGRLLNIISNAITGVLSECYAASFKGSLLQSGDHLLRRIIANSISKGRYDPFKISFLLEYLKKLSSLTFEGNHFTTGCILTRSHYAYNKRSGNDRGGTVNKLSRNFNLHNQRDIPKRTWFLVDGKRNFYLMDRKLDVNNIFTIDHKDNEIESYIDRYLLQGTLFGGDIAFRVINHTQYSFTISNQVEYINIENVWRLRHYGILIEFLKEKINVAENYIKALLFYILNLSQNFHSSIICIPDENKDLSEILLSQNKLFRNQFSIFDSTKINLLLRMLQSDGATVIDKTGNVVSYGCLADLSGYKKKGLQGSGASAASLLASKGTAIKVSQDGSIKVFYNEKNKPYLF